MRACAFHLETLLFGSLMLPKTMASAGHDCWHAVCNSFPIRISLPSRTDAVSVSIFRSLIRCTQYVHFSMTPRLRTLTSGLRIILYCGVSQS